MVPLLVVLTIVTFLTIDYVARRRAAALGTVRAEGATFPAAVPGAGWMAELSRVPAGLFLAPGHTWLDVEPSGAVRLGSDRLPATMLGGVDRLDLPRVGSEVRAGEPIAVLRRGGREIPLRSPIDGQVSRVNSPLLEAPDRMRTDPFGAGWLCEIRPRHLAAGLRRAFVAEEARAWMARELRRFRDVAVELSQKSERLAFASLPDGGFPAAGLPGLVDPEDWNRLVEEFFGSTALRSGPVRGGGAGRQL